MGLKERRKKIMALMLAACVAGTSVVPVAASDVSVFSDGTDASPEAFDSADVDSANVAAQKTIYINFYDEEANAQVKEEPMQVPADATSVNASSLTAPEGYELVLSGDFAINDSYVYASVRKVATTKTVKINYYSEEEKKQIAEVEFTVDKDATSVNTSKLTAPEGYELVLSGDLAINDGYVYAAVRKVATTKTVKINYYSEEEKKQIAEVEFTVDKDATSVNTSKLTAPEGYELVLSGDLAINDGYVYAAVRKVATTKTVKINYYSEEEKKQIAEVEFTVDKDATSVNTSKLTAPEGYELVLSGDLAINDGYVYAAVRKVATTKTVKINYYSEEEKKQIAEVEFTVDKDATSVNTSKLTAPEGYELVLSGDLAINDGYVYAEVRRVATTKTVKINFYCPDEKKQIAEPELEVAKDATSVNTSKLTVPEGYELVEVGDLPIRDGYVYAEVRKAATTKTVKINFYCPDEKKQIAEPELEVAKDATSVNTSKLTVPEGYELVEVGDLPIRDGYVYAEVRKAATTKTVKINFYCPDEKKQIAEPELEVAKDATSVNTSKLTVPEGYELVEVGDLPIRDGYVYAEVRKAVTTKGITVVYQDRKGNVIKTAPMTVDKDATYINTGKLTAPDGYTIGIIGDIKISQNNKVYITVDQNKKSVTVIFEESGNVVSSKKLSVVATAQYVDKSRITAPAGYRIATTDSKFEISKNNTVTVEVKRSGKTIKVVYRLAKTNRIVTTGKIVVDKKATSIKASEVPVPAGYKMVTTGSCSVRTKKIEIYVKK